MICNTIFRRLVCFHAASTNNGGLKRSLPCRFRRLRLSVNLEHGYSGCYFLQANGTNTSWEGLGSFVHFLPSHSLPVDQASIFSDNPYLFLSHSEAHNHVPLWLCEYSAEQCWVDSHFSLYQLNHATIGALHSSPFRTCDLKFFNGKCTFAMLTQQTFQHMMMSYPPWETE